MLSSSSYKRPDTAEGSQSIRILATVALRAAMRLVLAGFALPVGIALFACLLQKSTVAQAGKGSIHGVVTDPSSALVPNARVTVSDSRKVWNTITDPRGNVLISGLGVGVYSLTVTDPGFAIWRRDRIQVRGDQTTNVDIRLALQTQNEQIIVDERNRGIGLNADDNASGISLYGADLDALPDDPSELQAELVAIAGPTPGSDAGEIYVDGFSGTVLPAKSTIRAISINQNPFSARYDKAGFGRIEIMTKAGTDRFHGDFTFGGNDSVFNSRNPFAAQEQPYNSILLNGDLSGPVTRNSSFFLNAQRSRAGNDAVVDAVVLDTNLNEVPFSETIPNPSAALGASGRFDAELGLKNMLSLRWQMNRGQLSNSGVGQFALPSQEYDANTVSMAVQGVHSAVFGPSILEQSQFQYVRQRTNQDVSSLLPATVVQGAFTSGGNASGNGEHIQNEYEAQENISLEKGAHSIQFGGRFRIWQLSTFSKPNFNGQFLFPSIDIYRLTEIGLQQGLSSGQIRAQGGGASQFDLGAGNPAVGIAMLDLGLYWQDDWKLRTSLTGSYGIRFESQDDIHDRADPAPRLGIAWAPAAKKGGNPRTIVRVGYGWFYTRFAAPYVLQAAQQDGIRQQQYIVADPDFFPSIPAAATLGAETPPTVYKIGTNLRSPLLMETQISIDRQLGRTSTLSISYSNSRGIHQFLSRNINAPLPGTYDPANPNSGVRPLGNDVSIYQYDSDGVFRQNQLTLNLRTSIGRRLTFFGYYSLNKANADTEGPGSFPSNQYDLAEDWGRADYDIRQRFYLGGAMILPDGFQISPRITASSGAPFNVVVGEDLNGDGQFNDRPAFATDLSRPSVIATTLGIFDTDPIPGQRIIPVNLGTGPPQFAMNLRLAKTISFGPEKSTTTSQIPTASAKRSPANRRYSLSFDAYVRNVFNNVNLALPVGTLGSPLFGKSNALSSGQGANRTINLNVSLRF